MDKAVDRRDGTEFTAEDVAALQPTQRQSLKPHLRCPFCEATAHFRSASRSSVGRRGKVAHFYALPHGDECDITRSYGDPWDDDDSDRTVAQWEQRNTTLIVRILTDIDNGTDETTATDAEQERDSRSRNGGDRTRSANSVSRGPQKLLEQLVQWPSFKTSSLILRMPDQERTEMPVHDAFVLFEDARNDLHTEHWLGFWGVLRPFSFYGAHDTYYSNFGASNQSFRIAVHMNKIPSILARYGLSSINDMAGHYLLLFDRARESGTGRFMADINSVNHIGFLRNETHP